jgi:molybdopterin-guanine dinucleotide biosynthesis protein A
MPFLNLPLLRYMILLSSDFDVVIPHVADQVEPLHAVYSKGCAEPISTIIASGQRRIVRLLSLVQVRYVVESEIDVFDPEHRSFFNINTEADLQRALQFCSTYTPGRVIQAAHR